MKILAKSYNETTGQREQTLVEHTKSLLKVFEKIFNANILEHEKYFIRLSCILHDLGKINKTFQHKIRSNNNNSKEVKREETKEVRHNVLSGAFLKEIFDCLGLDESERNILYKTILLHHGSFIDLLKLSNAEVEEAIYHIQKGILENDEYELDDIIDFLKTELGCSSLKLDYTYLTTHLNQEFRDEESNLRDKESNRKYIIYKGFLNLIDHLASSQIEDYNYYNPFSADEIDDKLKEIIKQKNNVTEVRFNEIQEKTSQSLGKNILTIAFTGSGKTIADHRWYGKRKFYLVPNKISAESFYFESQKIYGEENVGILHGDIHLYTYDPEDELYLSLKDESLTRNFAKPYIVSTIDQLILAMYKHPNYEKTFASIYDSKITVDEVHLLTPQMFLMLIYFMQFANKHLNTKFHLMTATLPKVYYEKLQESGLDFEENYLDADNTNKKLIRLTTDLSKEEIPKIITKAKKESKKVLIVVNTIKEGMNLYKELKNIKDIEINLLHSRFKLEDKKQKYSDILAQKGDVWIATQMVEVALDLDFYIIISQLAPMDALIQRMGRCNRHNTAREGEFYVLKDTKDGKDVYDKETKAETNKLIKKHKDKILNMKDRKELLEQYYNNEKIRGYYEKKFEEAERMVRQIFGIQQLKITEDNQQSKITGEDLIFEFESYKNLVSSRKEASRLFRDGQNIKVILEEDFEEITAGKQDVVKKINIKSIPITEKMFFKFIKFIDKINGVFVLKKGYYNYDAELGLRVKDFNNVEDRFF